MAKITEMHLKPSVIQPNRLAINDIRKEVLPIFQGLSLGEYLPKKLIIITISSPIVSHFHQNHEQQACIDVFITTTISQKLKIQ